VNKLREADVLASQGKIIDEISPRMGITSQAFYRWRKDYDGMSVAMVNSG
jgi:putative transposase